MKEPRDLYLGDAELVCNLDLREAIDEAHAAAPGSVLRAGRDGIDIACGEGALRIRVLQREGGKAIAAAAALNGNFLASRRDLRA